MKKTYSNGSALSEALLKGIDTLADNVASTLGPKGRNVILYHKDEDMPVVTKDGVTIAKFIELDDPIEHVGATIVKQAAEQSALTSGLMSIDDWIDQTLAAKGYIQAQEDREDFILRTGAGATKFNKWMKKAGLYFNKQTGRWSSFEDR